MSTRAFVPLVVLGALLVPILGVLPPAQFFRFDDFSWLTWASTHDFRAAFDPNQAATTPGGSFRPAYALFWLIGYRTFGPASAVPWILVSASFFAAGLVLLLLWGESLEPRAARPGVTAVAIWCAGFYPMTYFLLNVFNSGKSIVFFSMPLAVWSGIRFYERRRSRDLALFGGSLLVSLLTRESAFAIVPVALGAYILRDFGERGRLRRAVFLYGFLAAIVVVGAAIAFSPLVRKTLRALARNPDPARWLEGLRYYAGVHFWNGHRRFLWLGLVVLCSVRARARAFAVLGGLVFVSGFFLPAISPILTLLVLLAFWSTRRSKLAAALLAWFVVACVIVLPTRSRHESYFLEASFPLALFLGLEAGPAFALIVARIARFSSGAPGARRWRIYASAAIVLALLAAATLIGRRVFDRELLPIKRHGSDFAEANRFLVRELPRGSRVYVIDESDYGRDMGEYIRRFRRFYLWKGHPECWFAAYGRPDVAVLAWPGEEEALRSPAFLFASNPHEKALFGASPEALGMALLFENRSCAVFGSRGASGAAATERGI